MSETEPQKKGWFARFRSRGTPAVETPKPAEPEVEKTEPVEPAVAAEPETRAVPPQNEPASEPVQTAPQPETAPVEAVAEKEPEVEKPEVEKKGWLSRLRDGLAKSTKRVTESITGLFTKKKLDQETLNELEDALIQADLGVTVAARLVEKLGKERFGKEVTDEEVRAAFADDIAEILQPVAVPLAIDAVRKPHVVLAGDTFRAAAVEQLKVWGDRAGVPVVSKPTGADAAGLAYEALERARAEKTDVLLIDTAGRLHNKTNLMEELAKIVRVIRKLDPEAPHSCLLVLDATTGQNAHAQVETFKTMSPVDALVVTKLDGSAKGGVLVALAEKFKLPVVAIGVGEGIDDLRPFEARAFARGLMGLPA